MNAVKASDRPGFDLTGLAQDFRSLDPKDVGNWPAAPKVAVMLVLFALILVAGWWFLWSAQLDSLHAKRRQEDQLKREFIAKKRQAVNLDEYKKQLAEIDQAFGALLKQLPNKSEMEALVVDINQAGLGRGLKFELFKPGNEVTKDFYAELPITIKVDGGYNDLGNFAGDIAKLNRIVTLSNISLEATKTQQLKMNAVAMTYRYLDPDEMAKQRKKNAAGRRGARR